MAPHPVLFSVVRPDCFERFHVVVRLLILAALMLLGVSLGWFFLLLLLVLPAYAATQTSAKGGARYLAEDAPRVVKVLHWVLAAYAYLALLTDHLPDPSRGEQVTFQVVPQGAPTPGSALWRLVISLPALVALAAAGVVATIAWVVAMALAAVTGNYPQLLYDVQVSVLRYTARLLAYHASLVDAYPSFVQGESIDRHHHDDLAQPRPV